MQKIIFALAVLITTLSLSQETDFFNPGSRIMNVPKSPEVAAFEKFSADVNMYTGTPNISIPIYTIQGKELSVPISISYDASGIKVEQLATHIGLGWNLNFGGVISRNVNIHPDFYLGGSSPANPTHKIYDNTTIDWINKVAAAGKIHGQHGSLTSVNAAKFFYDNYMDNDVDYQPDTFSVNVNGLSGTIFVDYTDENSGAYKAYFLEDPLVIVEDFVLGEGFTLIDASGTQYVFDEYEVTYQELSETGQYGDEYIANYHSAWYLTEMTSPNGIDSFTFEYQIETWLQQTEQSPLQSRKLDYGSVGQCNYIDLDDTRNLATSKYKKDQVRLDKISYNGKLILQTTSGNRDDLAGVSKITGLNIYDMVRNSTPGNEVMKVILENNTYFGNGLSATDVRLKLDGLKIFRNDINDSKKYIFTYDRPGELPPWFGSTAIDYWGYYNGMNGNTDLAPKPLDSYNGDIANFKGELPNFNEGANRLPNFDKTKIGSLESIIYPTGGKTTFTYEQHIDNQENIVGGLRIRSVTTSSEDGLNGGNSSYETIYYYGDIEEDLSLPINLIPAANGYASSGIAQQEIRFTKAEIVDVDESTPPLPCNYNRMLLTKNTAVIVPHNITYNSVSQVQFNDGNFNGATVTHFYNGLYQNAFDNADSQQPFQQLDAHFGNIQRQILFDVNLNILQETENTFTTEYLDSGLPSTPPENIGLIVFPYNPNTNTTGGSRGCINEDWNTTYNYDYAHTIVLGNFEDCPNGYVQNNGKQYYHFFNSPFKPVSYTYKQLWVKNISSISRSYESPHMMETITTNTYSSSNHYLPTEVTSTDSKGGINKVEITYSVDYADLPVNYPNTTILQSMVNDKNMKLVPVQQTKSYAEAGGSFQPISMQWMEYKDFDPASGPENQLIKPYRVYTAKGTNDPEIRMVYSKYDEQGNLQEGYYPSGLYNAYVWGYNGQYLLSEVKNVSYGNIENMATLTTLINTSDDPYATEANVAAALDGFRSAIESQYPQGMMTGYIYEPGVGVKAISDEKGYTTYFYYDQHNRLVEVKDANDMIISENIYNYREN